MYKKIKNISLTIGVILLILIILVLAINFTFGLILPRINLPMYVGTDVDWLNFIGIFLGSGLTLFGVYWQLKKNKEENYNRLISNTTATYGLLEMESQIIRLNVVHSIDQFELVKKTAKNESEIKIFKDTILESKNNSLLTEKSVIFSFINDSLPKEKIILIDSTSKLMLSVENIKEVKQFNKKINDFEKIKPLYKTLLENIDDYIQTLESRKKEFEKQHSLNSKIS